MHPLCDNHSTSLSVYENVESSVGFKYAGGNFTHKHLAYIRVEFYLRLKKKKKFKLKI